MIFKKWSTRAKSAHESKASQNNTYEFYKKGDGDGGGGGVCMLEHMAHTRAHIEGFVIHCFVSTFIWNNYCESKGVRACISKPLRKKAAYPTELLDVLFFSFIHSRSIACSFLCAWTFEARRERDVYAVHGKNELYIRVRKTLLSINILCGVRKCFSVFLSHLTLFWCFVSFHFLFVAAVAGFFFRFSFTWFKLDENRINILCWALPFTSPASLALPLPKFCHTAIFCIRLCLPHPHSTQHTHTPTACVCKMKFLKHDEKIGEKCRSGIDLIKNISFHLLHRRMKWWSIWKLPQQQKRAKNENTDIRRR